MSQLSRYLVLLGVPLLLAACGQSSSNTPNPPTTTDDTIPFVPRPTRPNKPTCVLNASAHLGQQAQASPAWLEQLGGPANLRGVNVLPPRLNTQANPTLYDFLYDIRTLINQNYWGSSTVDLQAVHAQYEGLFRKSFGNLKNAGLSSATDAMTNDYIDAIGDGHTYFLTAAQLQSFNGTSSALRYGIISSPVPGENGAVLLDVTVGSPADLAGLKRGDTILSVNGTALVRQADDNSTRTLYSTIMSNAASTGQAVTLNIRRVEQPLTLTVKPAAIKGYPQPYGNFVNASTYWLRLPTFEGNTVAQQVHDLIRKAQAGGATNLILDLRDDGGGLLAQAMAIAGAFVQERAGETIEVLNGDDETYAYRNGTVFGGYDCSPSQPILTLPAPAAWKGRTVVLVNGDSASASEIVAQLLRKGGAQLFGEKTYGISNTVTTINRLQGGGGLAVTIGLGRDLSGQYFTPDVTPNNVVTEDLRALAHGTDNVLQAALATLP